MFTHPYISNDYNDYKVGPYIAKLVYNSKHYGLH
jgi:hypothetical protein